MIFGALLLLVVVYSLVLLLKTVIYSLRHQSNSSDEPPSTGKRQLCPSCVILHGRRSPNLQQQPRGADGLANYQCPARNSTAGLNFKCSECSVRLSKSTMGGTGFYGKNLNCEELDSKHLEEFKVEQGAAAVAMEETPRETSENEEQQVAESGRTINFDCSLQTVLEIGLKEGSEGEKETETETNADNGRRQLKVSRNSDNWRKILQANSLIRLVKRIAQENGSRYQQFAEAANDRLRSASLSRFDSVSRKASDLDRRRRLEDDEPEFLSSRKLRSAEIQM